MPFPFVLSTTSHLIFQNSLSSSTHPSLPPASTSQRSLVRSSLKSHKRLSSAEQAGNLTNLVTILYNYLKYLFTLDLALSGRSVSGEDVDVALIKEIEVEWRPTLGSSAIPGRDNDRVKGKGLDYEIYFTLHTLALTHALSSRQSLLGLYASTTPTTDERLGLIQNATKNLKAAFTIHAHLCNLSNSASDGPPSFPPAAADISLPVQTALQYLSQAELNLLAVLKDDPYPAVLLQSRNKNDREWMIKAPDVPKVRAQVLRRLCIGAGERAAASSAALTNEARKVSKDLIEYCDDVRRTARAKACRFAAIDADIAGETGKAIAWLRAGMNELGIELSKDGSRSGGFSKLKASWNERREDRKITKGNSWGADGGKAEESRILEYLDQKLTKENDAVNVQLIPDWKPLLATMPSGMNMPIDEKWKMLVLQDSELAAMRAPPDGSYQDDGSSSDENEDRRQMAGAFPGSERENDAASYY